MEESSSEELSRELSNFSLESNVSSTVTSATESRKSTRNAASVKSTFTDENVDDISRENTELSVPGGYVNSESDATAVQREDSSIDGNNDTQEEEEDGFDMKVSSDGSNYTENEHNSCENSYASQMDFMSRESTTSSENQSVTREPSAYSADLSRETTKMSEQAESSEESDILSRENTNSQLYQSDFETSRESTVLIDNEMHADDSKHGPESSLDDDNDADEADELEKENSVLIERDGKFELVNRSDLEADELEMLGLSNTDERPNTAQRPRSSSNRKPDYTHITSPYALSETQREMKKRRISVRQMRVSEEKQRMVEEEEQQKAANEKSYKKWLLQKSATSQRQSKKEIAEAAANEERRKLADKSYNLWLKEKEQKQKEERKIEKIRLADEAEHYIVRDRVMCERSFRLWLKQKKHDEETAKMPVIEKPRKKPPVKVKQKQKIHEQKPQSAIIRQNVKLAPEERRVRSNTKLNRKPKVRYAEMHGYRHPPSIDDLITYTR